MVRIKALKPEIGIIIIWIVEVDTIKQIEMKKDMRIKRISMVWFGLVLWDINLCSLFNAKSSLYIYSRYIWFGLVWFYGTSTTVGYLMSNPLYTYILNICDLVWFDFMAYQPF